MDNEQLKQQYRDWRDRTLMPALFERLDEVFPEYRFRRRKGASGDRWVSPLKMDLSQPKVKTLEKTVVSFPDMKFREQGEWENGIGVLDMYRRRSGIEDFGEMCRDLAARLCISYPSPEGGAAYYRQSRDQDKRKALILETLEDYFAWNLLNNTQSSRAADVRSYLIETRGFTRDAVAALRFGFVPEWTRVLAYMESRREKFTADEVNAACPVVNDEGTSPVGRIFLLAIPYRCGGQLRGFLFRRIRGEGQKYFAVRGMERKDSFFGVPERVGKDDTVVIVEGEIDSLRIRSLGIPGLVPVAIGGDAVTGQRRAQMEDLLNRGARKILFWLDMDAYGSGASMVGKRYRKTMASVHTVKDIDIDFENIYVADPDYEWVGDPDAYIVEFGKEAFEKIIREAPIYPTYFSTYWKAEEEWL